LIKIDVEGAELDVLEGGANTIDRCRPCLIVELSVKQQALTRGIYIDVVAAPQEITLGIGQVIP
jgi:hypothetical protein